MNVTKVIYENVIDETERYYIFFVIILSKYQHDSITWITVNTRRKKEKRNESESGTQRVVIPT